MVDKFHCSTVVVLASFVRCAALANEVGQESGEAAVRQPYFSYDAESQKFGEPLPQPPFFPQPWQEASAVHPKRGEVVADPTAPQGKHVMRWDVTEARTKELFHEIKFDRLPEAQANDFFYAFFVRVDRKDGKNVWRTGDDDSFDKAVEVIGDGIRWVVHLGNHGVRMQKDRFSCYVSNATYHLNTRLEENDGYYPNHGGFSRYESPELQYETWHAIVFKMKWATDDTGEIGLWVNGRKVIEHRGLKTAKAPGTFERLQLWGTIAQPAYDAPPHVRKLDALLFTDDWRSIERGGYLKAAPVEIE